MNDDNLKSIKLLLEISQKKLAEIEGVAKIGIWEFNISTQEVSWSDQMFKIFVRSSTEGALNLSDLRECVHVADRLHWELLINKVTIDGQPSEISIRIQDSNNKIKWIRKTAKGIFEDGKIVAIRGFCQDITELKRLENHFQLTKEFYGAEE